MALFLFLFARILVTKTSLALFLFACILVAL